MLSKLRLAALGLVESRLTLSVVAAINARVKAVILSFPVSGLMAEGPFRYHLRSQVTHSLTSCQSDKCDAVIIPHRQEGVKESE